MSRIAEARIAKLEARQQRPEEILLIWRRPDGDVKAAASEARFAPGDRVICVEWFGDEPPPTPKWHRKRLSSELSVVENEYLDRSINRSVERVGAGRPRSPGFAEIPSVSRGRVRELADNDLLHIILGVPT